MCYVMLIIYNLISQWFLHDKYNSSLKTDSFWRYIFFFFISFFVVSYEKLFFRFPVHLREFFAYSSRWLLPVGESKIK